MAKMGRPKKAVIKDKSVTVRLSPGVLRRQSLKTSQSLLGFLRKPIRN